VVTRSTTGCCRSEIAQLLPQSPQNAALGLPHGGCRHPQFLGDDGRALPVGHHSPKRQPSTGLEPRLNLPQRPPASSPVGAQVCPRVCRPPPSKRERFAPWRHRPPPVHRWERKFGSESVPFNAPRCGPSPLGHIAPRGFTRGSASLSASPPLSAIKKRAFRPLATPPPTGSPVGAEVWQRVCPLQRPKMRTVAPWPHRPPPVHRWERKFEQRERLPHRPKMRIVAPWSHRHQYLLPTKFTAPSLCSPQTSRGLLVYTAVSAEVEQLSPCGTRPPNPRTLAL